MSGQLTVIGLGPGDDRYLTREAVEALDAADALYGYGPYLDRVEGRRGQTRHASDNREEGDRAEAALGHAVEGAAVAIVSGGDPGVFAMAASVCEAVETGPDEWRALDIVILPGVTAMLAVAARAGAPLGHDFCAISLSDNLKPWELIERRLDAAASAGFVIALYNPVSRARPGQLAKALKLLVASFAGRHAGDFRPRRGPARREHDRHPACFGRGHRRRHGDAHHRRLERDAGDCPRRPEPADLHAAGGRRRHGMIEPGNHLLDRRHRRDIRQDRALQHDDRQAQRARRFDLAVGGVAAAVLGDDDLDAVALEQGTVLRLGERARAR